jgi:SAM-dependent methyltransferase
MKKVLLEILICPLCLPEEHRLKENVMRIQKDDIIEGYLTCGRCGSAYPIQSGIAYLEPRQSGEGKLNSKYETIPLLSSYLWSHYGDLLQDPEACPAYTEWAGLVRSESGFCIDIGSAVGRFSFEMSKKSDFVIGIDNSVSFIRAARELMVNRRKPVFLLQEGLLAQEIMLHLPEEWKTGNVEFIVGDAQALPLRSRAFSAVASLNLIDKVPFPMKHLKEMNRVAKTKGAQLLLSDPFSWSIEVAKEEDWLGGTQTGIYTGKGIENIINLLRGGKGKLLPEWRIERNGHVWWKIRNHCNHFELIRSCFVKAYR